MVSMMAYSDIILAENEARNVHVTNKIIILKNKYSNNVGDILFIKRTTINFSSYFIFLYFTLKTEPEHTTFILYPIANGYDLTFHISRVSIDNHLVFSLDDCTILIVALHSIYSIVVSCGIIGS